MMAKHNIQKTHIHIFHNKLLREVAIILDVVSDSDNVMRAKVILTILALEFWKKTKQWHKKYEKYQFSIHRRPKKIFYKKLFLKDLQYSQENMLVSLF